MRRRNLAGQLMLLAACAVAAGHLDAVALIYLQRLADLPSRAAAPSAAAEGDGSAAVAVVSMPGWAVPVEETRAAAGVIVVVVAALLAGRNLVEKLGGGLYVLGLRQVTTYAAAFAMVGWPRQLADPDWTLWLPRADLVPVWIPLSVAAGLVAVGAALLVQVDRYNR